LKLVAKLRKLNMRKLHGNLKHKIQNGKPFIHYTILDLLNLAREGGWESSVHINRESNKEKKRELERSFGNDTGYNTAGNVRLLIANHVTGFKNSYFWTC
jgi:hypothetical protein